MRSLVTNYHSMNDDPLTRTQRADAKAAASQRNGVSPPRNPGGRTWQKSKPRAVRERGPKFLAEAYGLSENPFGVTPDPRYLFESSTHLEAKSSLIVGIECAVGFQALIAPPGMGKTTLLCNILEQFDDIARTAFLFQTQGNSRDFLRYLISELGGEAPDSDVVRMQETINQLLIRERRAGRQTIVIIDEAQNLAPAVLETLRLLSNFETSTDKLLHIILAGQPQLAQKLASPEAAQLSQRICILTTLQAFSLEDTGKYIEHRLKVAGYQGEPLFSPEAVGAIWKRSGGIPREINKVCFNSLLLARATKKKRVESSILREVTSDLDLKRVQSRHPLRLNEMLKSQAASSPQPANQLVENMAARIDRLCDDSAPSAATEVESTAQNDMSARVTPSLTEPDSAKNSGVAAAISVCYPTGENIDTSEDFATEFAADPSPLAYADEADGNAVEISEPVALTVSDSIEEGVESAGDDADEFELSAEAAADSLEESDEGEGAFFEEPEDSCLNLEDESAAEAVALLEAQDWQEVPWTKPWFNQQWRAYRATIYLGLSGLALLLALFWAPHSSPKSGTAKAEPSPMVSENSSVNPGQAAPFPPADYHPKARVWVDVQTDSYYCPGSPMYGTTAGGKFTTQLDAHRKNFKPANREFCQ
jgi:type II secretory pathway predicted ATPase ExeA